MDDYKKSIFCIYSKYALLFSQKMRHYFNHIGFWYLFFNSILLLILCDDVEQNPGPKDTKYLSLCHWNLNSLAAHDFAKVSALKAY